MVKTVKQKVEEKIQKSYRLTQFYCSGCTCPLPKGIQKGIFRVLKNIRCTSQIRQGFRESPEAERPRLTSVPVHIIRCSPGQKTCNDLHIVHDFQLSMNFFQVSLYTCSDIPPACSSLERSLETDHSKLYL